MLDALGWLALEVKYLPRAREFYADTLSLPVVAETDRELRLDAGAHELRLRRPDGVPRGGLHTHFAFATPPASYDAWWRHLEERFALEEHTFGSSRSLYCYDPDGNCVEIGQRELGGASDAAVGSADRTLSGIFEVVLEVEALPAAEAFYADLGFETVDRGADRKRVRMTGPVDLELWEPHLGLADARGGVHVDLGFATADPEGALAAVSDRVCDRVDLDGPDADPGSRGVRVRDPDGHWLTLLDRS